jgi:hypothetical protein
MPPPRPSGPPNGTLQTLAHDNLGNLIKAYSETNTYDAHSQYIISTYVLTNGVLHKNQNNEYSNAIHTNNSNAGASISENYGFIFSGSGASIIDITTPNSFTQKQYNYDPKGLIFNTSNLVYSDGQNSLFVIAGLQNDDKSFQITRPITTSEIEVPRISDLYDQKFGQFIKTVITYNFNLVSCVITTSRYGIDPHVYILLTVLNKDNSNESKTYIINGERLGDPTGGMWQNITPQEPQEPPVLGV